MLKSLKASTSARHAALERRLPLLDASLSRSTYQHHLRRLWGFYEPLEAQLLEAPCWNEVGIDYGPRHKTPRLRHDLQILGDTPDAVAALPQCQSLPPLTNPAQLWGCLYVIEGATLGGQIIIRHLHTHLGLSAISGASFFDGYGAHTGAHWKAFCAAVPVNADVDDAGRGDAMLRSANLTFDLFSEWLFPGSTPSSRAGDCDPPSRSTAVQSGDVAQQVGSLRAAPGPNSAPPISR
jgi:heme oxygenase